MDYKCTPKQFLGTVKNHKIEIIRNDGLYRHIRMSKEDRSFDAQYDVITWPGHLCITGDYGSYLFARIDDMFKFFRNDSGTINPFYWSEKVLSQSIFGHGVEEFSVDKFRQHVIEDAMIDVEDEDEKKAIMDEIQELLDCEGEWECIHAMNDFHSKMVEFTDFWEHDCEEYTFHYIWCLYAVVFAIRKYDEAIQLKPQ
jgi:hypothetical protein